MSKDFDYIVIGSGFGGSVMSCRLVEKGYNVCLLERGKEYKMHEFPRRMKEVQDELFWDPKDKKYGYMEVHNYPKSDIMSVTASGLGGGSLIYANVLLEMPPEYFDGWPYEIKRETLNPYYSKVLDMMEASPYPFDKSDYYKDTPKTAYYKQAAQHLEKPSDALEDPEFVFPNLAVRFEGDFPGAQSKNKHGAIQSSCNKCGECDIGCNIHAKNTLDLNYIFRAKNLENPLEVMTESEVTEIIPKENGYEVKYCHPKHKEEVKSIFAKKVVVSAGSIGSTSILLKQQAKGNLNNLSSMLGQKWCGNGDLLGFTAFSDKDFNPTKGPVITSAITYKYKPYKDGFPHGMYIEDAGFPVGLAWYLNGKGPSPKSVIKLLKLGLEFVGNFFKRIFHLTFGRSFENLGKEIADSLDSSNFTRKTFVLLGMGRDRSDGKIEMEGDTPVLTWNIDGSELHYDRVRDQMGAISHQMGGKFIDNPLTEFKKIIAVHPLGGCPMGESINTGVVDKSGEVYGHPGLYVVDGSILPTSTGPNPSLTIGAMAEMIADQIPNKGS